MVIVGPLKVKVQLFCGDWHAMGPGKADLLAAIEQEGSVAAAGRAMGMPDGKCRLLVDRMNHAWAGPLVEADGASARLTDLGRAVLADFRTLEAQMREAAVVNTQMTRLLRLLRPAPALNSPTGRRRRPGRPAC